jgi:hypothetical protein
MLLSYGGNIGMYGLCCQLQMSSNFSNIDSSPCFHRLKLFINLFSNINILLTKSRRGSEIKRWETGNVNFFKSKSSHRIHVPRASQTLQNVVSSLLYDVFSCWNRNPIIWKKVEINAGNSESPEPRYPEKKKFGSHGKNS